MWVVAGGVFSVHEKHLPFVVSLRYLAGEESVLLLCIYTGDETFLCLEVKGHGVALILVAAHLKHRCAEDGSGGVSGACGMHEATVEVHVYLVALQVHVLILHVRVAVEECKSRRCLVSQGVFGCIFHRRVDTVFPLSVDTVEGQGVVYGLVMMVNGEL